jgi:hypothetical protein
VLKNVGFHYETWKTGILGPVLLNGLDKGIKDLSWQKWSYQVRQSTYVYTLTQDHLISVCFIIVIHPKSFFSQYLLYIGWPKRRGDEFGLS